MGRSRLGNNFDARGQELWSTSRTTTYGVNNRGALQLTFALCGYMNNRA